MSQKLDGCKLLILHCAVEFLESGVDAVVELHNRVVGPQLLFDLLPGHHLAWMLQQHFQNLEGLFLKANLAAVLVQLSGLEVQLDPKQTTLPATASIGLQHSPWRECITWLSDIQRSLQKQTRESAYLMAEPRLKNGVGAAGRRL